MGEPLRATQPENTSDHVPRRGERGRWLPGCSPNPGGRPKVIADIQELARQYTETALKTLHHIATKGKQESARVAASSALLDRAWGRPTQPLAGDPNAPPVGWTVEDQERELARQREERAAAAVRLVDEIFGADAQGHCDANL
jgi:hypothetical protein